MDEQKEPRDENRLFKEEVRKLFREIKVDLPSTSNGQYASSSREDINAERKQLHDTFDKSAANTLHKYLTDQIGNMDELEEHRLLKKENFLLKELIKKMKENTSSTSNAQYANSSRDINAERKQLHDTFDKSMFGDLVIKVGLRSIYVNKSIVAYRSCSPYFKKIDQFITSEDGQDVIRLDQFSYVTVYTYFKYIYTGNIDLVSLDKKFDLLIMAEKFNEMDLQKNCYNKIKEEITKENLISIYRTAQRYNNKEVQGYCFKFFIENANVSNMDSFKELDEYTRSTFINEAKKSYGYYEL